MAYVRKRGNQLAIVHGERDAETGKVEQRILFTIYSKPEARAAIERGGGGRVLRDLLAEHYPGISLNWMAISKGIADNLDVLPDTYEYQGSKVRGRFEEDMLAFARQLLLADGTALPGAANPIHEHRRQLECVADLLARRLGMKDDMEDTSGWDPFGWRVALRGLGVPVGAEQHAIGLFEHGEYRKAEAAFELLVACFPECADGHNYLGLVAVEEERLDDAAGHFEHAVEVGRRLFPKRIGKKQYWNDLATRPYMRGLAYLADALNRLRKYDDAIRAIERLETECADEAGATTMRAAVCLNAGRWRDAAADAEKVRATWPEDSLVAGFARFEMGDGEGALAGLLHAFLKRPRATGIVLGLPLGSDKDVDVFDHNAGVQLVRALQPYLADRRRASIRFFREVLRDPRVVRLQRDVAQAERRWREAPPGQAGPFARALEDARTPETLAKWSRHLADLIPANRRSLSRTSPARTASWRRPFPCAGTRI